MPKIVSLENGLQKKAEPQAMSSVQTPGFDTVSREDGGARKGWRMLEDVNVTEAREIRRVRSHAMVTGDMVDDTRRCEEIRKDGERERLKNSWM